MKFKMIELSEGSSIDDDYQTRTDEDEILPICFFKRRHTQSIEGAGDTITQSWRMKDRMKTVSVALVVCLNVSVDPPDLVKIQPCAKLECWIDPSSVSPQKAIELIGTNLQKQYERWQPRARYKLNLDPTVEDIKKLCTSLRRNAKDERILYHYNGHGVPRPTANGEIWAFNRTYTQYIPLSIYELQTWMGTPSIYVYDCSNAGLIVDWFHKFAEQHEREMEQMQANTRSSPSATSTTSSTATTMTATSISKDRITTESSGSTSGIGGDGGNSPSQLKIFKNCIQLAACGSNQLLPMNPELPADLFTSCLTTPLRMALRWYTIQRTMALVPQVTLEMVERIPGQLKERGTMLGELNWIFTAITDTIAWNVLPRDLFQKLFRQDLLVASLFRNFLLAERILRSYDCTPVSSPALPQCFRHPMWLAWDMVLDSALSQLPNILRGGATFQNLPFFEEQLTAFEVWLERGNASRDPPEQLPIVLQVLLSPVLRLRALALLARFVDMGPWAVNLALSAGIFPYVLRLLQADKELRLLLVFIWAKILAVDVSCQVDLIRDQGHKHFLSVLQDQSVSAEYRKVAAFVLTCIVHDYPTGKIAALQGSLLSMCLVQINDQNWVLKQWLALCLGQLWQNYDKARWSGVRDNAHEKLFPLLSDVVPEVRAAAVFALGTFISSVQQRTEHANNIDRSISMTLWNTVSNDMSPLVRMELLAALQWVIIIFEAQFVQVFVQDSKATNSGTLGLERNINMKRVSSSSSLANISSTTIVPNFPANVVGISSTYAKLWNGLLFLSRDPYPGVSGMAIRLVEYITNQAFGYISIAREAMSDKSSLSLPPSPNTRTIYLGDSPPKHHTMASEQINGGGTTPTAPSTLARMKDAVTAAISVAASPDSYATVSTLRLPRIIRTSTSRFSESEDTTPLSSNTNLSGQQQQPIKPLVTTKYYDWSVSQHSRPSTAKEIYVYDKDSIPYLEQLDKFKRNAQIRREARDQYRRIIFGRLDNQIWCGRTQSTPYMVQLHPYENQIAVAYRDRVLIRDWSQNRVLSYTPAQSSTYSSYSLNEKGMSYSRVSSVEFMNAHLDELVLVGYEDGYVRLWRPPPSHSNEDPHLVSAWFGMADGNQKPTAAIKYSKNQSSFVMGWHQPSQTLVCGGESRVLCVWDVEKELKIDDLALGTDSSVRVLSLAPNGIIAAGCGDGSVRIFDRRLGNRTSIVQTYHDHNESLLTVSLRADCENLVTGGMRGTVRLFDLRKQSSLPISSFQVGVDVTAMAIHTVADVVVCGTQGLTVYGLDGQQLSQIRCHEGFMGSKIGLASCLTFHPYKVSLGAGFVDNNVSVFMLDPKRH